MIALAAAVFVVVGMILTLVLRGGDGEPSLVGSETTQAADSGVMTVVPVGRGPLDLLVAFGGVWVANNGDGTISRIDLGTNRVVATIDVGSTSLLYDPSLGPTLVLAATSGSVWSGSYHATTPNDRSASLLEIDPATNEIVRVIPIDIRALDLLVDETGDLWVSGDGVLLRVDPESGQTVARLSVSGAHWATTGAGALWVIQSSNAPNTNPTGIVRIDLATNRIAESTVWDGAIDLAFGEGSLWVSNSSRRSVQQVDPATGEVVNEIALDSTVPNPATIAFGKGSVWVDDHGRAIVQINATTGAIVAHVPAGAAVSAIAIDEDSVWFTDLRADTVTRFTP